MEELQLQLETQIAKHNVPGASLALLHEGDAQLAAAGFANQPEGISANTDTVFQIGSITKVFTATLMLKLAEQGRVELDGPVSRYLPDLRIEGATAPEELTVRSLLDYSAGMEGDFFEDFGPDPQALERYVAACRDLQFIHRPGAMRAYNSTAYCIAGRVIETLTGQYFNDALAEHLLRPLGLEKYGFYTHDVLRYRTAVGHTSDGSSFSIVKNLRLPHCMSAAGASLSMTARDLLRFGQFHLDGGRTGAAEQFISSAGIEAMRTPYAIVPPQNSELLMGWAALQAGATRVTVASGATPGQNSFLIIVPEQEFAVSILSNSGDGATRLFLDFGLSLIKELTGLDLEMPPQGTTPPSDSQIPEGDALDAFCGTFCNGSRIEIQRTGDELLATSKAKVPGTADEFDTDTSRLIAMGDRVFGIVPEGGDQVIGTLEFLQQEPGSDTLSHIAYSGRVFCRERKIG